ncbi:TonB-dependent receptor [Rubrivivax sp. A210]|uniref:TonB-dependent receptor n=1 Tax=Rubrivivax sp. A210 TaxID=2772301 RepID=UPI0019189D19|nr:TonB-dependent receptor [Rubrivivax sp. A210]CAD5371851.1 TonB-dependent receptor [Rubrivivax sp. A210]
MYTPIPCHRAKPVALAAAALAATVLSTGAFAQAVAALAADAPQRAGGVVVITASGQPTTLPTQIPTTMEGITRAQLETTINASDSEDALKYFPSLLVRKRYIGDYNHAILSSRASGTGNSARSAVYADGILLSNYLGNGVGGLSFPPRWGMVTPEEIDRVDVMYGPFSAAYPGNSVGAVVVYVTRMPSAFEAHARAGFSSQPFKLYQTDKTFNAWETSFSVGNKSGDWAWLLAAHHADSHGQPLTFATRLASSANASTPTTQPVTGAVPDKRNDNAPWLVLGTGTEYHTKQDHIKLRLSYDFSSTLRANYLFGLWRNESEGRPASYLRDAAGAPVYSGDIRIANLNFTGSQGLAGGDFALTNESLSHSMHGLALKSHTRGSWDWEAAASVYDYGRDDNRRNAGGNRLPAAAHGGAGSIADGSGTGWVNLALKGTWRPQGVDGAHVLDFGVQQDAYELRYKTSTIAGDWRSDAPGALASNVSGKTETLALFAQDAWAFAPAWKTVLGLRLEQWQAHDGLTAFSGSSALAHPARRENYASPKAALSWQATPTLVLKASAGRAVRMPTVAELYGATSTTNSQFINDPNLKPERSWTTELSAEDEIAGGLARLTLFAENTRDSLYSQTTFDAAANRNISRVQNVGRIATTGLEAAFGGSDIGLRGLDLSASLTYTESIIKENAGFVAAPGDTIGKWQPNIARWRATVLTSYRLTDSLTGSVGIRYSGPQYRTLNNADVNGFTYQGVSKFTTADLRLHWKISRQWSAAFGIDNVNNDKYWNFHPYPQRSYRAELKFDL